MASFKIVTEEKCVGVTYYDIKIVLEGGMNWTVTRRFNDFVKLDAGLQKEGKLTVGKLPRKGFRQQFGFEPPDFMAERREGLEQYLEGVAGQIKKGLQILQPDTALAAFCRRPDDQGGGQPRHARPGGYETIAPAIKKSTGIQSLDEFCSRSFRKRHTVCDEALASVTLLGAIDQITNTKGVVSLDLSSPVKFDVLVAMVSRSLQKRTVRRLFQSNGTEIQSCEDLISLMSAALERAPSGVPMAGTSAQAVEYEVISTDGSDFKFKHRDKGDYRFGDWLLRPSARILTGKSASNDTSIAVAIVEPPQPFALPLTGNLKDVGTDAWQALWPLEEKYGPLVKLRIFKDILYVCADPDIIAAIFEVPDKRLPSATFGMKTMACQGVFIADGQQWELARTEFQKQLTPETMDSLVPAFTANALKMMEFAFTEQALGKPMDVMDWVERLTYDVICQVGFGYDPKMIERHGGEKEPFIDVFDDLLDMSINAALYGALDFSGAKKKEFSEKTVFLNASLDEMITKARQTEGQSLLHHLLQAKCPLTGRKFDQSELRDQLITLLVAGHKTTTLLMTWALWHIAGDGLVEMKLLDEIQEVFGDKMDREPTGQDLRKMPYLDKVVKETLRLASPVQVGQRGLSQPVQAGKYTLFPGGHKGQGNSWVALHIMAISHSPKYWENPLEFDPDRFEPEKMKHWHPYQYVPFGGGKRLCIGNLFAITQVKVALTLILRKFAFRCVKGKEVKIRKDDLVTPLDAEHGGGVWLKFHPRKWDESIPFVAKPEHGTFNLSQSMRKAENSGPVDGKGQEWLVIWGGEFGTTKKVAERLQDAAVKNKFKVTLKASDEVTVEDLNKLPESTVILVLMPTYNGHPPTNATAFVKDLQGAAKRGDDGEKVLKGRRFAVLAMGNSNWVSTFTKTGHRVDDALGRCGAEQIFPVEVADKNSSFDQAIVHWRRTLFHKLGEPCAEAAGRKRSVSFVDDLKGELHEAPSPFLEIIGDTTAPGSEDEAAIWQDQVRPALLAHIGLSACEVVRNDELCGSPPENDEYRSVKRVEIKIPASAKYECGDHLEVQPTLPPMIVKRVCERLKLHPDAVIRVQSNRPEAEQDSKANWMVGKRCMVKDLLGLYCDPLQVPSQEALAAFADATEDDEDKAVIEGLLDVDDSSAYKAWQAKNINFIEALEEWQSVQFTLARFVEVVPHVEPRLYSIASSPLVFPNSVELCLGVVRYDNEQGVPRHGLASSMISERAVSSGSRIVCKIKQAPHMRLPTDPSATMVCVCGGTGLAPFLGFLSERKTQQDSGIKVGLVALYFGCRSDYDFLHSEQLREWEKAGICRLSVSYSRKEGVKKEYVYHALQRDADFLRTVLAEDSKGCFYICGSASTLAKDSTSVMQDVLGSGDRAKGMEVFNQLQDSGRIVLDVWG